MTLLRNLNSNLNKLVDMETNTYKTCLLGNKFCEGYMQAELIILFKEFIDKQERIKQLSQKEKLLDYNLSEIHTIAAIGDLEEPNVTNIYNYLNMNFHITSPDSLIGILGGILILKWAFGLLKDTVTILLDIKKQTY